ncbi:DegT/DnrJ/EryC1/StrS family aminotransferase [Streptomyces albipurpureus]|uniref:Aminotransferase class I/II-fold pyridoxal phosphate-dependent enzyme n=1 Tax=Streptomyces albipurpureus TaxID=2897419 RepID=A0ABT0UIW0_9ACTN|nr:aminotransferase class I/II-fold pyridoxal phosphate-dependent enzyme [Streptomyces sp. CWNU-1]MCM2388380.1 aminotransferase class I/II-fold pyridoxal phosphate-dependent enzyme [Streptomyces sp. CWNU-1]
MNEREALELALSSLNQSGKSDLVARYESELAAYFGTAHAVAVSSGSAAIEATLVALGARPGKRVLVSAAAPLPTLMPILATGAAPKFVDCLPRSPAMDPDQVVPAVDDSVVAAVEVPLWGYPLQQARMHRALAQAKIPLVEDASHAHGALTTDGHHVGTHGSAGCFSTHHMKMLSTGEGGFILTDSPTLARSIRSYCRLADLDGVHDGRNYKPSAFTAAIGLARLGQLDHKVAARRQAAGDTMALLERLPVQELDTHGTPNGYNLVISLPDATEWRSFHLALAAEGISTDPVTYRYSVGYAKPRTARWAVGCPNAESLVWQLVQLPTANVTPEATADAVLRAWERWA